MDACVYKYVRMYVLATFEQRVFDGEKHTHSLSFLPSLRFSLQTHLVTNVALVKLDKKRWLSMYDDM